MLSLSDLDRICVATLAGAFGVRVFLPDTFDETEFRRLHAGVANTTRRATVQKSSRAGAEPGKE